MLRPGLGAVSLAIVLLTAAGASAGIASPSPLPLSSRVIEHGEFHGFLIGSRIPYSNAKDYVASNTSLSSRQAHSQTARLKHEGFKKALIESLDGKPPSGDSGISWVVQLKSAAAARDEQAAEFRYWKKQGQVTKTFRVKAIPGAIGFTSSGGDSGGENISFSSGPFVYLVGNSWSGAKHNPEHAALIEAATSLYTRVHGHPAG